jgi:hypothetical protein
MQGPGPSVSASTFATSGRSTLILPFRIFVAANAWAQGSSPTPTSPFAVGQEAQLHAREAEA